MTELTVRLFPWECYLSTNIRPFTFYISLSFFTLIMLQQPSKLDHQISNIFFWTPQFPFLTVGFLSWECCVSSDIQPFISFYKITNIVLQQHSKLGQENTKIIDIFILVNYLKTSRNFKQYTRLGNKSKWTIGGEECD